MAKTKTPKPQAKSETPVDITPLIVGKLQELVKKGSDGLYRLSVEQLKPDITSSTVDIITVKLVPDTAVLQQLDNAGKAPDDVFTISCNHIHITGLNVGDFTHTKNISLDTIFIASPFIQVAHTDRPYNAAKRAQDSSLTLYQKLTQQFRSIAIGAITVQDGSFTATNLSQQKKTTRLNGVAIQLGDIRIDSSTQYDKSRFLFSKSASFSSRDYVARTPDSLYFFKVGSFAVAADKRLLKAKEVALVPRGNKETFEKKLKQRNDMFTVHFPEVTCTNMDWWALINNKGVTAGEVVISNGSIKDYFSRALPSAPSGKKNNFPHQLLMQVTTPVYIQKLHAQNLDVSYEEYNPKSKRSGTVTFNNINTTLSNVTNVRTRIKAHPLTLCTASGLFMNKVPLSARIQFDLSRSRTGSFAANFNIGTVSNTIINPIAEPMGMYTLKSGTIEKATLQIRGDNYKAKTKIVMLYKDLTIFPLKDNDNDGKLKKKSLVGFFANTFVIKNNNPSGNNDPRSPEVIAERDDSGSFFNFLWKAMLTGIVKTIGLPEKLASP